MKNTKDNKKDKKVLIGALGIAAVITAGSTFAWFTSSDEVTNRLTAAADYGVSITETFTPPTEWLPGQEINKDVSAVNTGNIAAYVRLDLKHALQGTQLGDGIAYSSNPTLTNAVELTDAERKLLQAGGYLAYTDATGVEAGPINNSNSFTPTVKGLYIFRRQITDGFAYSGYYFDGSKYYALVTTKLDNGDLTVDAVLTPAPAPADTGAKDDGKLTGVTGVKIQDTKDLVTGDVTSVLSKKNGTTGAWEAASGWNDATHILVTYAGEDEASTDDDIVIALELDSANKSKWTYKQDLTGDATNVDGYFYYNELLAAGANTGDLITAATLDNSVQAGAYLDLTYDLTVGLDSVQMTKTEAGVYEDKSITPWVSNATVDGSTGKPAWSRA